MFAFESVGRPVLDFYGYADKFADLAARFNEYGAWAVLFAGLCLSSVLWFDLVSQVGLGALLA